MSNSMRNIIKPTFIVCIMSLIFTSCKCKSEITNKVETSYKTIPFPPYTTETWAKEFI